MRGVVSTIRAVFNSLFLPWWTVVCVAAGVCAGTLTRNPDVFYRWQRAWARGLFRVCGIELEVTGEEHMASLPRCVIIANHASYMDVAALFAGLPVPPQFIAKRELYRIPFVGTALRWGRHILIDRKDSESARGSLEQAAVHVRKGAAVLVFPEGTRNAADEVGKFKTGAFRLAKEGQAAIIPVGINGTRQILPKHGRLLRPHRIRMRIGEPIPAANVEAGDIKELCRTGRERVAALAEVPLGAEE